MRAIRRTAPAPGTLDRLRGLDELTRTGRAQSPEILALLGRHERQVRLAGVPARRRSSPGASGPTPAALHRYTFNSDLSSRT